MTSQLNSDFEDYSTDMELTLEQGNQRASQSIDAGAGHSHGDEASCLQTGDTPAASNPRKRRKQRNSSVQGYSLRSPASYTGRSLTEMQTPSPKQQRLSADDQDGNSFADLSQLPPESCLAKDGNEPLAAGRPLLPICADEATSAGTSPSSAGSAKRVIPINFSPHPSTLTKSGDRSFGGGCHEAVAEFIDNAIETSRGRDLKEIMIHLFVTSEDEKKAAIAICDRGKGMTESDIENFASYSYSTEDRYGGEQLYQTPVKSRHIDGRLSKHGVGSKNAAFHLGCRLTVITKSKEAKDMLGFCLDSKKLHSSFENKEEVYHDYIYEYNVADVACLPETERQDDNISQLVKTVSKYAHFTIILIGGLKKHHIKALRKQSAFELFRQQLSHIYHYYLDKVHEKALDSQVRRNYCSLKVTIYQRPGEKKTFDLAEETNDVESKYQSNAKERYEFTVDLRTEDKAVYQVQGLLLYFPSAFDVGETIPFPFDIHELFECFWQGRLIPQTLIPCLDFCKLKEKRKASQRDKLPDKCYQRLKGMLFFDRTMPTGHNKLNLLEPSDKLARMLNSCVRKREEKKFTEWLQKCHRDLDEEWVFCDETEEASGQYQTLRLSESGRLGELRAGDHICVTGTSPHMYGEVSHFAKDPDCQWVYISRRPVEMFPDQTDKVSLRRLDFHECRLDDSRWQSVMEEQRRKMPVRLRVGILEGGRCSLDDIPECTPSTAVSKEGFWIELYDGNGSEIKRLPGHRNDLVVVMKVEKNDRPNQKVEGSTEGFSKFPMTETAKYAFTFTVINKKNSESRHILLDWKHDVIVKADPPSDFHVAEVSSDVRLGSKEFFVEVDVKDQFHNPCKDVAVDVILSCRSVLKVFPSTSRIITDENGRLLLSGVQLTPFPEYTNRPKTLTGFHVVDLRLNSTVQKEIKVHVTSGPPASLQVAEPLEKVEQKSVHEKFLVKVLDAYDQAATVHQGEEYRVAAQLLNGDDKGTKKQYSDTLKADSRGLVAFHRFTFAFPDITATVGQVELTLLRRERKGSKEEPVCSFPYVLTVDITPCRKPARLLLYDDNDQPVAVDGMLVAPVGSSLSLAFEVLDARNETVDLLDRMHTHFNSYRLRISWSEQSSVLAIESLKRVGESNDFPRFLLPPLSVPEKSTSLVDHSVVLEAENDVKATVTIKPLPGAACQVVIDKQKQSVVCGKEGELRQLLSFFVADAFGNKLFVDETTDDCPKIFANIDDRSECHGEGDWQTEREVLELSDADSLSQSYTLFRLPVSAVVVGRGKATISAEATGCDRNATCTLNIQPGRPQRVEVKSKGFDDSQSFSGIHAMKCIRDRPLSAISAITVDRGGNKVKRSSRLRRAEFSAEILADGTMYRKVSFRTSTNECPLTIPDGLSAEDFTIRVKAETEDEVQPAQINCSVRLTNRVNAITLRDLNNEVLNDGLEFHAESRFPDINVSVETEDGLTADIDWNDMIVTARSPQGRCFQYECGESARGAAIGFYSYNGSDTLTDAGVYQLTACFEDKRKDLRQIYLPRQLQLQHDVTIAVLAEHIEASRQAGCSPSNSPDRSPDNSPDGSDNTPDGSPNSIADGGPFQVRYQPPLSEYDLFSTKLVEILTTNVGCGTAVHGKWVDMGTTLLGWDSERVKSTSSSHDVSDSERLKEVFHVWIKAVGRRATVGRVLDAYDTIGMLEQATATLRLAGFDPERRDRADTSVKDGATLTSAVDVEGGLICSLTVAVGDAEVRAESGALSLYVPQDALSTYINVKAELYAGSKVEHLKLVSHFSGMSFLSPVLSLEPHGQTFREPVFVRFPSIAALPGDWLLTLFRTKSTFETSENWQKVLEHDGSTGRVESFDEGCDYVPGTGMLTLSHFCDYCWCGEQQSGSKPRLKEMYCSLFGQWHGRTCHLAVYLHDCSEDVLRLTKKIEKKKRPESRFYDKGVLQVGEHGTVIVEVTGGRTWKVSQPAQKEVEAAALWSRSFGQSENFLFQVCSSAESPADKPEEVQIRVASIIGADRKTVLLKADIQSNSIGRLSPSTGNNTIASH